MNRLSLIFLTLVLLTIQQSFAQRNYNNYNKMGLQAGFLLFDIETDDFVTTQGQGFGGGFSARGAFRNDFDLIYGLNFMSSNISVQGSDGVTTQNIDYTIQGVQLQFLGSYNIVKNHLTVEFGPTLNITGKMKVKREAQSEYLIVGYNELKASDLSNISPINFRVMGGLTAGLESFRATAQYQYGVTNMLNRLNDQGLENNDFKGNSGTILLGAVVYF
jgi:hypothetical protein